MDVASKPEMETVVINDTSSHSEISANLSSLHPNSSRIHEYSPDSEPSESTTEATTTAASADLHLNSTSPNYDSTSLFSDMTSLFSNLASPSSNASQSSSKSVDHFPNLTLPSSNSTHLIINCSAIVTDSDLCDSFGDESDKIRFFFALLVSVSIVACSAPPAIAIWRTPSLHRPSYFYVMVLCLMDCVLGGSMFTMMVILTPFIPITGQVPDVGCIVLEVMANCTQNVINWMLLALSRDRYRSVRSPLRYRTTARSSHVWRQWAAAVTYGLVHGGVVWVVARLHFSGYRMLLNLARCDTFDWLLKPEYRPVAVIAVSSNVLIDFGTMIYNAMILHVANKVNT